MVLHSVGIFAARGAANAFEGEVGVRHFVLGERSFEAAFFECAIVAHQWQSADYGCQLRPYFEKRRCLRCSVRVDGVALYVVGLVVVW